MVRKNRKRNSHVRQIRSNLIKILLNNNSSNKNSKSNKSSKPFQKRSKSSITCSMTRIRNRIFQLMEMHGTNLITMDSHKIQIYCLLREEMMILSINRITIKPSNQLMKILEDSIYLTMMMYLQLHKGLIKLQILEILHHLTY